MGEILDLLGDVVPEHWGKRGRPPHVPTDEKRRLVMQLLAFDWAPERISAALSITPPTLRKHYFAQLKMRAEAKARVEAKLLDALMREAEAGNVGAIEKYLKRMDRAANVEAPAGASRDEKLGKKESARRAAKQAPTSSWGELLN